MAAFSVLSYDKYNAHVSARARERERERERERRGNKRIQRVSVVA